MGRKVNGERLIRDLREQVKDARRDGNTQREQVAQDALDRVLDMHNEGQKERR